MPAILTHDFFGRDALSAASSQVNLMSKDARDAFILGNQGPDPLFYLLIDPTIKKQSRIGGIMHSSRTARLMCSLHDALSMLTKAERTVANAYAAGFVCHYLLDSTTHPFVYSMQNMICDAGIEGLDRSDGSEVHAEIERELDEMVLFAKRNETVATYRPQRKVLGGSDAMLAIVDKLYFYMGLWTYSRTLDQNTFTHGVKAFRRFQRLTYSPSGHVSKALGALDVRVRHTRYSLVRAMSHRAVASDDSYFANLDHQPWKNPFTDECSTESFWDLYEEALSRVFDAHELFFANDFDRDAATLLTHDRNFSGELRDPEALEESDE